jgi:hypothetical protein
MRIRRGRAGRAGLHARLSLLDRFSRGLRSDRGIVPAFSISPAPPCHPDTGCRGGDKLAAGYREPPEEKNPDDRIYLSILRPPLQKARNTQRLNEIRPSLDEWISTGKRIHLQVRL